MRTCRPANARRVRGSRRRWVAWTALLLVGACAGGKEPAERSLADIDAVVMAVSAQAEEYLPAQLEDLRRRQAALRAALDAHDYAAVTAGAPGVLVAAQELAAAAAARKDAQTHDLSRRWTAIAATVPDSFTAIQARIDRLAASRGRKPRADIDLDAARESLRRAESSWSKAQAAFATGNLREAVATGGPVADAVAALARELKLELPAPTPDPLAPAPAAPAPAAREPAAPEPAVHGGPS